jgi:hypothetical protein
VSSPSITKKPLIGAASWALPVAGYNLTEEEQSSAVEEVTFPPVEEI